MNPVVKAIMEECQKDKNIRYGYGGSPQVELATLEAILIEQLGECPVCDGKEKYLSPGVGMIECEHSPYWRPTINDVVCGKCGKILEPAPLE